MNTATTAASSEGTKTRHGGKQETASRASAREVGGKIDLADDVVATIAGLAARQVKGIHALGGARLISFGDDPKRGVGVEIGRKEAALDLDVVIEYGCDIHETVAELRQKIATVVYQMAGRQVVEVNVNVRDIHLPEAESEQDKAPEPQPRVR